MSGMPSIGHYLLISDFLNLITLVTSNYQLRNDYRHIEFIFEFEFCIATINCVGGCDRQNSCKTYRNSGSVK